MKRYLKKITITNVLVFFGIIVAATILGSVLYWISIKNQLVNLQSTVVEYKNKNLPYTNPSLPLEERVQDLLSRMNQDEKIGQLALVEKNSIYILNDVSSYGLGGILSGSGGKPEPKNTPEAWQLMVTIFDTASRNSRLGIPILYGVDANHGHSNVPGATLFPHFIGLGATNDPDLVRRTGMITAQEMAATGIYWNFSPSIDVTQDTRWGRTYETFGSDTATVSTLGAAYLEGLQNQTFNSLRVIGTAKHYIGTGAMAWGTSGNPDFKMDQGVALVDEATLRKTHLPPFAAAVKSGVYSIMASHTTWNGVELAANHYLLTDVLKNELGFKGFIVSDWYGVYEIPGNHYGAVVTAINAGVDMVMLPYDYIPFILYMKLALSRGDITTDRLDDAVGRILRAKFAIGLFDTKPTSNLPPEELGSIQHRLVAREAVRKSLVILKDPGQLLPLPKTTKKIIVAGSTADNLGRQAGGWTIEWQGVDGNWITGTTILDGIRHAVSPTTTIEYDQAGNFQDTTSLADIGIAIVGEKPYSEGWGDDPHPALTNDDLETIKRVKRASKKLVVIIVSGRPLDIKSYQHQWNAVIAAWLPGSEGAGVADVLFGDYPFTGKLPIDWKIE